MNKLAVFLVALLGAFCALFVLPVGNAFAQAATGSIRVCKVIADPQGNVIDGSTVPGVNFNIPGLTPTQTSEAPAVAQFPDSSFTTALSLNADVLGNDGKNDAQCTTYSNLVIGSYYYAEETITPSGNWKAPLYNDEYIIPVFALSDFFTYDSNLFDGNAANDPLRDTNSDGHIVLNANRPNRTLLVLNQLISGPSVGGGGPNIGGNITTPQCPTTGPQKIDQVWFSNVKPTEVTVNWANKGDAQGFHISYGPDKFNLAWGVAVNDANATSAALTNLPGGDLWVSVTAKASKECGGPTTEPKIVGQVLGGPQVLGATGQVNRLIALIAGFGSISLGLFCTTKKSKV